MRISLERRIGGGLIRVAVESADIAAHSALTNVRYNQGIALALVNVLDVTQDVVSKERGDAPANELPAIDPA